MEKEKVLVRDNKGVFLKMFKRNFRTEFDFCEIPLLLKNENMPEDFDRCISVVYTKLELVEYLKMDKKDSNVLVCLFDKQLYGSLAFLEEINNLILLDESKTKSEILSELKLHFKNKPDGNENQNGAKFLNAPILQTQFQSFYKALFFLM